MKPPMNTEQLSRNQKLGDSLRLRVFVVKTGPNPPRRREEREESRRVFDQRKNSFQHAKDFCAFSWERTHPACGELETLSTLDACAPRDDLRVLFGREKKM